MSALTFRLRQLELEMFHLLHQRMFYNAEETTRLFGGFKYRMSECDHVRRSFNGYHWNCKDCGKRLD